MMTSNLSVFPHDDVNVRMLAGGRQDKMTKANDDSFSCSDTVGGISVVVVVLVVVQVLVAVIRTIKMLMKNRLSSSLFSLNVLRSIAEQKQNKERCCIVLPTILPKAYCLRNEFETRRFVVGLLGSDGP